MPAKKKTDVVVPAAKTVPAPRAPAKPEPVVVPAKAPVAAAKPAAKKAPAKPAATAKVTFSPEQRFRWINEAAYYLAERNGFQGDSLDYWAEAEKQFEREFN